MAEPTDKELEELATIARELVPDSKLRDFEAELRMMTDRPHQAFRFLTRMVEAAEGAKVKNFLIDEEKAPGFKSKENDKSDDGKEKTERKPRTPNPWRKESWNFTEQNRVTRAIGEKAARELCEAAGCKWGATRPAS